MDSLKALSKAIISDGWLKDHDGDDDDEEECHGRITLDTKN